MSHSETTNNYNLPLFVDDDVPTWLGDFNQAMHTADTVMKNAENNVLNNTNQVANLTVRVNNIEGNVAEAIEKSEAADALSKQNAQNIEASDMRIDALETLGTQMLIIGDSYTVQGNRGQWVGLAANALNLTPNIYAEGGAGFSQNGINGGNFLTLADKAIATEQNKEDFSLIIVYGGVNDMNNDAPVQVVTQNTQIMLTRLSQAFPNADIHVFAINHGKQRIGDKAAQYANAVAAGSSKSNSSMCAVHLDCMNWLMCPVAYEGDDLHPNQNGQYIIAQHIVNEIMGGEYAYIPRLEFVTEGDAKVLNPRAMFRNGVLYLPTLQIQIDWSKVQSPVTVAHFASTDMWFPGHTSIPVEVGAPTGVFAMISDSEHSIKVFNSASNPDTGVKTYNTAAISVYVGA